MPGSQVNIFPYALIRLAGESFDELAHGKESQLAFDDLQTKQNDLRDEIRRVRMEVNHLILNLIKSESDAGQKLKLINFRRKLYKDENCKLLLSPQVKQTLSGEIIAAMDLLFILKTNENLVLSEINSWYENEIILRRETKDKLIKLEVIQKGLVLSSSTLFHQIQSMGLKSEVRINKKYLQTEIGMLKYITRAITKTSPFSTFTNIASSRFLNNQTTNNLDIRYSGNEMVKSHVRINVWLLNHIIGLFQRNTSMLRYFNIRLNSTLIKKDDKLCFFSTVNNFETFQQIQSSQVNELIIGLLKQNKSISLRKLLNILEQNIESDVKNIEKYVLQLLQYGMIESDFGISSMDVGWAKKFATFLKESGCCVEKHVADLASVLIKLELDCSRFSQSSSLDRISIAAECHDAIQEVWASLVKEYRENLALEETIVVDPRQISAYLPFYITKENIFYEDTTVDLKLSIKKSELQRMVSLIDSLIDKGRSQHKPLTEEKKKMLEFFNGNYSQASQIDFLDFYEAYLHFKVKENIDVKALIPTQRLHKSKSILFDPMNVSGRDSASKQPKSNLNLIEEIIYLKEKTFSSENNISNKSSNETNYSYSCLVQLFQQSNKNGEELYLYLDTITEGYGKLHSRFLYALDDSIKNELIRANNELAKSSVIYAEIADASAFNANFHPLLTRFEINIPGAQANSTSCNQIPIGELCVRANPNNDDLVLLHKPSGSEVFILNLTTQAIETRSNLFQTLVKFNSRPVFMGSWITSMFNNRYSVEIPLEIDQEVMGTIEFLPRIIYAERIVIQRKTWIFPKDLLSKFDFMADGCIFFVTFNSWRKKNKLPDEIFVKLLDPNGNRPVNMKNKIQKKDDYKPQYVNFKDPLLVMLFQRLMRKDFHLLVIEEMLPNSSQLLKVNGKSFVSEFVFQWED